MYHQVIFIIRQFKFTSVSQAYLHTYYLQRIVSYRIRITYNTKEMRINFANNDTQERNVVSILVAIPSRFVPSNSQQSCTSVLLTRYKVSHESAIFTALRKGGLIRLSIKGLKCGCTVTRSATLSLAKQ